MRGNTPGGRVSTPAPRKPRPLLLLPRKRKKTSPVPKGHEAVTCRVASSPTAVVFEREHPPETIHAVLPEDELRTLRNTRTLFLCCRNLVSFSHIRHLEQMTQLSSLNVHMNAISRVECLSHLQYLTDLDISANELRAVDDDAFKGLCKLKRLNLSSNFLTVVNGFQHLPALEWLSLSFNNLEDMRGLRLLPCPHHLRHLDVCGNKIATLAVLEESLENCGGLEDLRVETPKESLVLPRTPPQLELRENPLCITEPKYAEKLLERFQRLLVLNGVSCGYDPSTDARPTYLLATAGREELPPDLDSPSIVIPHKKLLLHPSDETTPSDGTGAVSTTCTEDQTTRGSNSSENNGGRGDGKISLNPPRYTTCVSQGVLTSVSIPTDKEFHISSADQVALQEELRTKNRHLETNLKRAQEQLSLRVALVEDMRRNLKEMRDAHRTLSEAATCEKKLLRHQVVALKDELSRRSEEASILQRKNRVELEERTSAMRVDLLRQKKEYSSAIRRLEEELVKARRDASDQVLELNEKLDDAAQCKERLEHQNHMAQVQTRRWREELNNSRSTLLTYEEKLQLLEGQCQLQLEESSVRHQLEFACWCGVVLLAAARIQVLQRECESLVASQRHHQQAWEDYTASLQQQYREALSQSQNVRVKQPVRMEDVGCDPIGVHSQHEETEEMRQLQSALSLTRQSERLLTRENERLLNCLAEKDRELSEAAQQLQKTESAVKVEKEGLGRERENLMRTLHNLRETIEKKDAALEELEAEAKLKIDEKRVTISRLEARLEDAEDAVENYRHEVGKLQRVKEELESVKSEFQKLHQERSVVAAPQQQLTEMMDALEDTKQKLASSVVHEHQLSLKLARAADALKLLRQQLARVNEVNIGLRKELGDRDASLRAAEAEHRRLQEQWREVQEATRVRQRATLQALSQIMVEGDSISLP